jgi:hypothetical protein
MKQMFWAFLFDIKHGGKYRKHWDLKGFTNINITEYLIFLFSICLRVFIFGFGEIR